MRASIHRTARGWSCRVQQELGYYSTLGEAMAAAYATENGAADHLDLLAVRDRPCHHCRFAEGSGVFGVGQGDKGWLP